MTLEGLGNLGDFIGGIAVVVTLIYLAIQIRQNTRQVEHSIELARANAIKGAHSIEATLLSVVQDGEVAHILRTGLGDYHALADEDRLRFTMLLATVIAGLQTNVTEQLALGIFRDPHISDQISTARRFLDPPGGREWWKRNASQYAPVFRDIIEKEIMSRPGKRS